MNRTKAYQFNSMLPGDSFTVTGRHNFQHARVAASDHSRKTGNAYTCRIQEDGLTMIVHRCDNDQLPVDRRGSRAKRKLAAPAVDPTRESFMLWLTTLPTGTSVTIHAHYSHLFDRMQDWCEIYSLRYGKQATANQVNSSLIVSIR